MKEVWVKLDDLVENGQGYSVSNLGNVWSNKTNRLLKPGNKRGGYVFVCFSQEAMVKQYDIHRLVAIAFLENNDEDKREVNHIDGDKSNNRLENLEWVTPSQNKKHAYRTGLRKPLPPENMVKAIQRNCRAVTRYEMNTEKVVGVYQSGAELARLLCDIPPTSIHYQCANKSFPTKSNYYHRFSTQQEIEEAKTKGMYYGTNYPRRANA